MTAPARSVGSGLRFSISLSTHLYKTREAAHETLADLLLWRGVLRHCLRHAALRDRLRRQSVGAEVHRLRAAAAARPGAADRRRVARAVRDSTSCDGPAGDQALVDADRSAGSR